MEDENFFTYGEYDDEGPIHVLVCRHCEGAWEYSHEDDLNRRIKEHAERCTSPRFVKSKNTEREGV